MGFRAVELAGYYGRQPGDFAKLLADNELACCGAHVPIDLLAPGKIAETTQFHQALGNRTLVVPGLPERMIHNNEAWVETAHLFQTLSETLRQNRMRLGYHNHAVEFRAVAGQRPWDIFFGSTSQNVFAELDLGNAGYGGADPVAILKQYPGRIPLVHVKDFTATKPDLLIGDGSVDWRAFFPAAANVAGTEWLVVEHDSDPSAGLADIANCLERLRLKQAAAAA